VLSERPDSARGSRLTTSSPGSNQARSRPRPGTKIEWLSQPRRRSHHQPSRYDQIDPSQICDLPRQTALEGCLQLDKSRSWCKHQLLGKGEIVRGGSFLGADGGGGCLGRRCPHLSPRKWPRPGEVSARSSPRRSPGTLWPPKRPSRPAIGR